jgi:hypothetical protein
VDLTTVKVRRALITDHTACTNDRVQRAAPLTPPPPVAADLFSLLRPLVRRARRRVFLRQEDHKKRPHAPVGEERHGPGLALPRQVRRPHQTARLLRDHRPTHALPERAREESKGRHSWCGECSGIYKSGKYRVTVCPVSVQRRITVCPVS